MTHNSVELLRILSVKRNTNILTSLLEKIGMYNIIPYNFIDTVPQMIVCHLFDGKLCNFVLARFCDADPEIDYTERNDVYFSNLPSGAGYRNFIHYA